MTDVKISWLLLNRIFIESRRGKTLARILLNHALSDVRLSSAILDFGSSSESASYNRFLKYEKPYQVTRTDLYRDGPGMVKLDLEKPFPLPGNSFDHITCFNVLEHIYSYRNCIGEAYRVLKSGGTFVGGTPFLVSYHSDPHDYFRYTHEGIEKIFTEIGFVCEQIISLGFGPLTVAAEFFTRTTPNFLNFVFTIPAVLLDSLILRLKPKHRGRYALGYMYVFKKS